MSKYRELIGETDYKSEFDKSVVDMAMLKLSPFEEQELDDFLYHIFGERRTALTKECIAINSFVGYIEKIEDRYAITPLGYKYFYYTGIYLEKKDRDFAWEILWSNLRTKDYVD